VFQYTGVLLSMKGNTVSNTQVSDDFYVTMYTGLNRRAKVNYGPFPTIEEAATKAREILTFYTQGELGNSPINDINRAMVDVFYGNLWHETGRGNRGFHVEGFKCELRDIADNGGEDGAVIMDATDIAAFRATWDEDTTDPETLLCYGPMVDDFCTDCTPVTDFIASNILPTDEYYRVQMDEYSPGGLVSTPDFWSLIELRQDEIDVWLSKSPRVWGFSQIAFPGGEHYDDEDARDAQAEDIQLDPDVSRGFMTNIWFGDMIAGDWKRPDLYRLSSSNEYVFVIDDADAWVNTGCSCGFTWGFSTFVPQWTGDKSDTGVDRYIDHWYVMCEVWAQYGGSNWEGAGTAHSGRSYYDPSGNVQTDDYNRYFALGDWHYVSPIYDSIYSGSLPPDAWFFGKDWITGKHVAFPRDGSDKTPWAIGIRFTVQPVFRVAGEFGDCDAFEDGTPATAVIIGRSKRNDVTGNAGTEPGERDPSFFAPTGVESFSTAPWDFGFFVDSAEPEGGATTAETTRPKLLGFSGNGLSHEDLNTLNGWNEPGFFDTYAPLQRIPNYKEFVALSRWLFGVPIAPSPVGIDPETGWEVWPFPPIVARSEEGEMTYGAPVFGTEPLTTASDNNGVL
jgi:hypothetical protein